jgi:hypothetical protein
MVARAPAAAKFSAMSFKNAVLKSAASAAERGGHSLVFALPGSEAFAMTATPQYAALGFAVIGNVDP